MIERRHLAAISLALSAMILTGTGCEDAAARERAQVQQAIADAGMALREATALTVAMPNEQAEAKLEAVVGQLNRVSGGRPGQRAAAAMLAASAHEQLGALQFREARELEAAQRVDRLVLHGVIDAAAVLDAIAAAQEASSTEEEQQMLHAQRQAAEQRLRELGEELATLDQPLAQIRGENQSDQETLNQLRAQQHDLLRRAAELGYAGGFESFEQATRARREADDVEYRINLRDLEHEYELRPQHDLATARVEHHQALIEDINQAVADLQASSEQTIEQAQTTRERIAEFRAATQSVLNELKQQRSGALSEAYAGAVEHFEQAAEKARQAQQGVPAADTDAARLTAARGQQALAQAHWSQARGLEGEIALLARLAAMGETLGSPGEFTASLQAAQVARDEAAAKAQQALEAAAATLDEVNARDNRAQIDALRNSMQAAIAAISGEPSGSSSSAPPVAAPGNVSRTSGGYATPEELLAFLSSPAAGRNPNEVLSVLHAATPEGRQAVETLREILGPSEELQRAIEDQFGVGAAGETSSMLPDLSLANMEPEITERTDDRATVTTTLPDGTTDTTYLINLNGSWHVDGDAMSPEERQMLGMMKAMAPAMKQALADLTRRVRAGEFSSPQEVMAALNQAMMAAGAAAVGG